MHRVWSLHSFTCVPFYYFPWSLYVVNISFRKLVFMTIFIHIFDHKN